MNALLSQKIETSKLQPGDHVYSWRKTLYSHHGIFIGEGKVIHLVNSSPRGRAAGGFNFSTPSRLPTSGGSGQKQKTRCTESYCGLEKVSGSGVRLSCINCFIKEGSIYRFEYQVSLEFLLAKLVGGTCTTAESDPPEEVIHRANYLHHNGYHKYDLMNNNCEDFALYCKTGLWSTDITYQGRSSQANMVHTTPQPIKNHAIRMLTAVPRAFTKRKNKDLGNRDDVVKVPVEELSSFILRLM